MEFDNLRFFFVSKPSSNTVQTSINGANRVSSDTCMGQKYAESALDYVNY